MIDPGSVTNPAALTGLEGETGSLAPGAAANLVAVSPEGHLTASFVNGVRAEIRN